MNTDAWMALLEQTLGDERLSDAERRALRARLAEAALDDRARAVLRSRVFELARGRARDPRDGALLDWVEAASKLLLPFPEAEPMAEAHFSPGEGCAKRIAGLIDAARSRVDVCVFTVTDDRLSGALAAAHARGVAVRVATDDEKASDEGSDVRRLAAAGVPVRTDLSPYHMHHKFALFDGGLLLTGSYNWTRGAALNNQENLVLSNDKRLLAAYQAEFERLWAAFRPLG